MNSYTVIAFYDFFSLDSLEALKLELEEKCRELGIIGLIVLGSEGINSTVAGFPRAIFEFKEFLIARFPQSNFSFNESSSVKRPFKRLKVDIRDEIVTLGLNIDKKLEGSHLTPEEWHELLSSEQDVILVDTRNFYEFELGHFKNSLDPKITMFTEFPEYLEKSGLPKDKKLLMYCTGGIRCEKAAYEAKRLGYENTFQLRGGILAYLEKYPEGFFEGECFIFDHRVAVDKNLEPSRRYKLCPHCGNPGDVWINCGRCEDSAVVCKHCLPAKKTCSKNCDYHLNLQKERAEAKAAGGSTPAAA